MASKTDVTARKDAKLKRKFYVGEVEVTPIRYGRKMLWLGTDGVYYKKWTTKSF